MSESVDISRRNLMFLSVGLTVFHLGEADISQISFMGLSAMKHPEVMLVTAWVIWGWFLWRFFIFHRVEIKRFLNRILERAAFESEIQERAIEVLLEREHEKGSRLASPVSDLITTLDGYPPDSHGRIPVIITRNSSVDTMVDFKSIESKNLTSSTSRYDITLEPEDYEDLVNKRRFVYMVKHSDFSDNIAPVVVAALPILSVLFMWGTVLPVVAVTSFMLILTYRGYFDG